MKQIEKNPYYSQYALAIRTVFTNTRLERVKISIQSKAGFSDSLTQNVALIVSDFENLCPEYCLQFQKIIVSIVGVPVYMRYVSHAETSAVNPTTGRVVKHQVVLHKDPQCVHHNNPSSVSNPGNVSAGSTTRKDQVPFVDISNAVPASQYWLHELLQDSGEEPINELSIESYVELLEQMYPPQDPEFREAPEEENNQHQSPPFAMEEPQAHLYLLPATAPTQNNNPFAAPEEKNHFGPLAVNPQPTNNFNPFLD